MISAHLYFLFGGSHSAILRVYSWFLAHFCSALGTIWAAGEQTSPSQVQGPTCHTIIWPHNLSIFKDLTNFSRLYFCLFIYLFGGSCNISNIFKIFQIFSADLWRPSFSTSSSNLISLSYLCTYVNIYLNLSQ